MPDLTLVEVAQVGSVRRWLRAFGPYDRRPQVVDGLTVGEVKRALRELEVAEVRLDHGDVGVALAMTLKPSGRVEAVDSVAASARSNANGVTPSARGCSDRTARGYSTVPGNIGPSVWSDGRIVGGWAQRKNGTIAFELLEDIGAKLKRTSPTRRMCWVTGLGACA